MLEWDEGLTKEQRAAAGHKGGNVRLLAGPGTGKTYVLVSRVLCLMQREGVAAGDILVLTFTRHAASELRERLKKAVGDSTRLPHVSTLHSYALQVLLDNAKEVQLPTPLRVADDFEEEQIIKPLLMRALQVGKKRVTELFKEMSADWHTDEDDWEARFPEAAFIGEWRSQRRAFGYTLRDELVYQLRHALGEGAKPRNVPCFLCVDEYQDLNPCDLVVIRRLTQLGASLFASGDDDQSIYGFRFAKPEGIREFGSTYPDSVSYPLTTCMRCDRDIITLGVYIADLDPRRLHKELVPKATAKQGRVEIRRFADQEAEATGIAEICQSLAGRTKLGEILVLLRDDRHHKFSRPIAEKLRQAGLAVSVASDPLEVFNIPKDQEGNPQCEGRRFLAIMRLLADQSDSLAWCTILLLTSGISLGTVEAVYRLASERGTSFAEALTFVCSDPSCVRAGKRVRETVEEVRTSLDTQRRAIPADLPGQIASLAGAVIGSVVVRQEVVSFFDRLLAVSPCANLDDVLRTMSVSMADREQETDNDTISIMTMHQAKGLTKDAVIIAGAEQERIPGDRKGRAADDERRLLYVSATRPRHYLFVTYCSRRCGQQAYSGTAARSGKYEGHLTEYLREGPFCQDTG